MALTSEVPITVKVRIGMDWNSPLVHDKIAPHVHKWGATALTIHGRSKVQRYKMDANWDYIDQCAQQAKVPVIGNGDLYDWREFEAIKQKQVNVSGYMVARGAIQKPWVFKELKEGKDYDISASERYAN